MQNKVKLMRHSFLDMRHGFLDIHCTFTIFKIHFLRIHIYIRDVNLPKAEIGKIVVKKIEEFVCGKSKLVSSCEHHGHKTINSRGAPEKN